MQNGKELKRGSKLAFLLREYHSDFPPNAFAIFVEVAKQEGIASSDLVDKLKMPKATVSRNLRLLGDKVSPTREGMHLIELKHDPMDYRVRRAYLTTRGQEFLTGFIDALK